MLSSRRSVDSVGLVELEASIAVMRRTSQTLRSVSASRRSSSRRVVLRAMAIAGEMRRSARGGAGGELHVAGALELLVDPLVHAAAGVDEAVGDDRQAAALVGVAGGAEEALGRIEGDGVDAAGEGAAGGGRRRGIGGGPAGGAAA